mmetsp:Transcript_1471/g.5753  ORF Transcript_1471/g.5753 Transcript_1471/m.5753 type:complete len:264 (-) Transcript_1471:102-893(-)
MLWPTHLLKLSWPCTAEARRPSSARTSTRMQCVSPTAASVSATSGLLKSAKAALKRSSDHQSRGRRSHMTRITAFQMSGAVPIDALESPLMRRWSATVAASGNGHGHVSRVPTRAKLASASLRKKSTRPPPTPASRAGAYRPPLYRGSCAPKPRFVMSRLTAPEPPRPAVKYWKSTSAIRAGARSRASLAASRLLRPGKAPAAQSAIVPASAARAFISSPRALARYSMGSATSQYTGTRAAMHASSSRVSSLSKGPAVCSTAS